MWHKEIPEKHPEVKWNMCLFGCTVTQAKDNLQISSWIAQKLDVKPESLQFHPEIIEKTYYFGCLFRIQLKTSETG